MLKDLKDIERMGELLAQSKICGSINPAAGAVIIFNCLQTNTPLEKFIQRYHVIPTMAKTEITRKAETMVADFLEAGGTMEILERSPERCAAKFTQGKTFYTSDLKWAEIQNESYTKGRDGKTLKENWSTPRRRMQMMWARCISDGIRVVNPAVTHGQYTEEEAIDFDGAAEAAAAAAVDPAENPAAAPMPMALDFQEPTAPTAAPVVPPPIVPPAEMPPVAPPPVVPQPVAPIDIPPAPPMTPVDIPPAPPVVPSAPTAPAPFNMRGPDGLDYTTCRCPGQYSGVKWAMVPPDMLQMALNISAPNLYDQDREEIRRILAAK